MNPGDMLAELFQRVAALERDLRVVRKPSGGGGDSQSAPFRWMGTDGQQAIIATGYVEGRFGYREVVGANAHAKGWRVNVGGNATAKHLILATGNETTAQILPDSVLESSFMGDTANEWRRVLYRVYLSGGRPVLDRVGSGVGGIVL